MGNLVQNQSLDARTLNNSLIQSSQLVPGNRIGCTGNQIFANGNVDDSDGYFSHILDRIFLAVRSIFDIVGCTLKSLLR